MKTTNGTEEWVFDPARYEGYIEGPWFINGPRIGPQSIFSPTTQRESYGICSMWPVNPETHKELDARIKTARLIADAPRLLAEVVRLRAENERLKT